mmetsp:Transcript_95187/g.302041  ORF Transcript_95187/g.302041 Transcript_95187/m.302041 type:complete len:238 (+) Transcript_95187:833-1546(+)
MALRDAAAAALDPAADAPDPQLAQAGGRPDSHEVAGALLALRALRERRLHLRVHAPRGGRLGAGPQHGADGRSEGALRDGREAGGRHRVLEPAVRGRALGGQGGERRGQDRGRERRDGAAGDAPGAPGEAHARVRGGPWRARLRHSEPVDRTIRGAGAQPLRRGQGQGLGPWPLPRRVAGPASGLQSGQRPGVREGCRDARRPALAGPRRHTPSVQHSRPAPQGGAGRAGGGGGGGA